MIKANTHSTLEILQPPLDYVAQYSSIKADGIMVRFDTLDNTYMVFEYGMQISKWKDVPYTNIKDVLDAKPWQQAEVIMPDVYGWNKIKFTDKITRYVYNNMGIIVHISNERYQFKFNGLSQPPVDIMVGTEISVEYILQKAIVAFKANGGFTYDDLMVGMYVEINALLVNGYTQAFIDSTVKYDGVVRIIELNSSTSIRFQIPHAIKVNYGRFEHIKKINMPEPFEIKNDIDPALIEPGVYVKIDTDANPSLGKAFSDGIKKYKNVARVLEFLGIDGNVVIGAPYQKDLSTSININQIVEIVDKPTKGSAIKQEEPIVFPVVQDWVKSIDPGLVNYKRDNVKVSFNHAIDKVDIYIESDSPGTYTKKKTISYKTISDLYTILSDAFKEYGNAVYAVGAELVFVEDVEKYATPKGHAFMKSHNFIATLVMVLDDDMVIVKTADGKQSAVAKSAIQGSTKDLMVDATEATVEESEAGEIIFKQSDKQIKFDKKESLELKSWLSKQQ